MVRRLALPLLMAATLLLSACSAPHADDRKDRPITPAPTSYADLAVPIRLVQPAGMPLEVRDPHLLTWKVRGNDEDKIRVMVPTAVMPDGAASGPAPADYHAYLAGLRSQGARITADRPVTVGGAAGRLFTITSTRQIDSGVGCWSEREDGCFGLPPDLTLRMATVTVDGHAVVLWARTTTASPNPRVVSAFESMLPTVEFP